jgi:hypothetical protein
MIPIRAPVRQRQTFQEQMRIALHEYAVFERSRLRFIGVADNIFFRAVRLGNATPFPAGWETGAPTSPEPRAINRIDNIHGRAAERYPERLVSAGIKGAVD